MRIALAAILVSAAARVMAADTGPILDADRAMAALSASQGIHAALAKYFAPRATVVSGGIVKTGSVAELTTLYPEGKLMWQPTGAAISNDGTLGITWGEWHMDIPNGGQVSGSYNTAWRKGPQGRWQVILDGGSPKPAPTAPR